MKITQIAVQIDTDKPSAIYLLMHNVEPDPIAIMRLEINEPAAWIGSLFVQEEYRGKGVGTMLIHRAIELCHEMGKKHVSLSVADKNEGAQRLYKSLGFEPFMAGHEGYMQYVKTL